MQTTLKFKPQSITNALMEACWIVIGIMIFGTIVIKFAARNSYSAAQPLFMVGAFWFATCILFAALAVSYYRLRNRDYQLIEINQNQTGIWVTRYYFRTEQVYVPFDWLKIVKNGSSVRLDWQRALQFDRKKRPHLQARSGISLNREWFDSTELNNFLTTVDYFKNGAVGAQPQLKIGKHPRKKTANRDCDCNY